VRASVSPVAVKSGSPLGATTGVTNLVEVIAHPVGRVTFRGPGAGGPATASAVLGDLLAIARGAGSSWGPLPPARTAIAEDDRETDHAWFIVLEEHAGGPLSSRLTEVALAQEEEAIVTRPMGLTAIRERLIAAGDRVTLYPVLAEA
jgi:hypothetical protein